ncbi:ATP-binding protein [Lentzea aerocolonigenes]|uniref:ATP-binding protein n=1 Tax=Lentzea aerocolonigenes TaxID=68170 RepID=UPI000696F14A|nr:LuxR C-terminal-related transcriptional regulator [Lentzea aerocolonigenes]
MTVRGDLPAQTTTFIGRRAVLAETGALLGKARLVTLVGAGGVGKTRIAVETGRAVARAGAFQHGVWVVPLADLKDPALLARTVAAELRIVDNSPDAGLGRLVESLYDKHLMLVLDNCEHLLEPVRRLVHHLLRDCEGLTILTTSREQLGVYGEHLLWVPPLGEDAVQLFVERAEAAGAALSEVDLSEVGALCRALGGVPLAIELAAARLAEMSLKDVLEQLGLPAGDAHGAARHVTLERAFEWSARHCTDEERLLWAALSVFPADFDRAAAEAVAGGDVLASLSALVRKSIVVASTSQVTQRTRYRLLDTVSQFGARLLADEYEPLRRHVLHYSEFADEVARSWFSPDEALWMARLWEEWPNIRAAVGYALGTSDLAEAGAVMAMNVQRSRFTSFAGMLGQARDLLAVARKVITEPPLRTSLLAHCAHLAQTQGDMSAAVPLMNEARELPRMPMTDVDLVFVEATNLFYVDGSPDCVPLYAHVVELSREYASPGDTYIAELMHAMAACFLLDAEAADKATTGLIRLAESNGVGWSHAWGLWHQALYELLHGDPALVHPLAVEALRIQLVLGDTWGPAYSLWLLACTCAELGAHDRAARLLGALRSQERVSRISFGNMKPFQRMLERADRTVRRALGDDYQVIMTLGADLRQEQAMEFALEPVPDSERKPVKPTLPGGLTKQEFTIAGLVAEGFTSAQIGARLFISPRTADRHVVDIRAKLGLPNRVALAAWHRSATDTDTR